MGNVLRKRGNHGEHPKKQHARYQHRLAPKLICQRPCHQRAYRQAKQSRTQHRPQFFGRYAPLLHDLRRSQAHHHHIKTVYGDDGKAKKHHQLLKTTDFRAIDDLAYVYDIIVLHVSDFSVCGLFLGVHRHFFDDLIVLRHHQAFGGL